MSNVRSSEAVLNPPDDLPADARDLWMEAVRSAPVGVLSAFDRSLLERWSRSFALLRRLSSQVEVSSVTCEDERGRTQLNPAFTAMTKLHSIVSQCEKELGWSPVARSKVEPISQSLFGPELDDVLSVPKVGFDKDGTLIVS